MTYFPFQPRSGCLFHSLGPSLTFFEPKRFKVCVCTDSPVGKDDVRHGGLSPAIALLVKAPFKDIFPPLGRVIFETRWMGVEPTGVPPLLDHLEQ